MRSRHLALGAAINSEVFVFFLPYLCFFPFSLRSLRTRFVKTPFFLISSWATIEHLRSFWRNTSQQRFTKRRHSASVLGQGPDAPTTRCCSTKGGVTAALKCFLGGLVDFWLKESEKTFRSCKHTCIAYNKGTKPQHPSRPWFCTNRRPHPFLDPLLLLSPQPRKCQDTVRCPTASPQTSPHCLLRIALTSRCPRSCNHFKRFGLAPA